MKNRLLLLALWAFFGFFAINLFAQETEIETEDDDDLEGYDIIMEDMKGLTVFATEDTPDIVTREEMDREGSKDLFEALRNVPGVIQSGGGARNDSSFMIRGFDSASMPLYIDGVTQADPYRGDADAARILSGDIESIQIEKGFSSMLLGANTMGGAIIVRTAKPKNPFDAGAQNILGLDSLGKFANNTSILSVGCKRHLFYAKGTFQYRGIDHYRLSDDFEPVKSNPQGKGDRLWSNSNDIKLTMLAGLTPVNNLDLCVSWIYEDSYKGFSPPAVNPSDGLDYQIWEWPRYDRQTVNSKGYNESGFSPKSGVPNPKTPAINLNDNNFEVCEITAAFVNAENGKGDRLARKQETEYSNLIGDALVWWAGENYPNIKVDFGFYNGGLIIDAIGLSKKDKNGNEVTDPDEVGIVKIADIKASIKDDKISIIRLPGSKMKELFDYVANVRHDGGGGHGTGFFGQVSNECRYTIDYTFGIENKYGQIPWVTDGEVKISGEPIDPARGYYTIVTTTYLAEGGDGYAVLAANSGDIKTKVPVWQAVAGYMYDICPPAIRPTTYERIKLINPCWSGVK